jgi:ankyrin repeat protein
MQKQQQLQQQFQQPFDPNHINPLITSTLPPPMQGSSRARAFAGHKRPPPTYNHPSSIDYPASYLTNSHSNDTNNANNKTDSYIHNIHQSALMTQAADEDEDQQDLDVEPLPYDDTYETDGEPYDVQLLRHFISGDTRVPSILSHPPADLDFNIIIDDEGHTSLHWAAAIGHLKIVKLLLHHGADIYRVNYKGQTALIRAVLFTNNFERRCFPHMLEMLRKTIFNIDKKDQTVFHHIALTAGWKGKVHTSRYYMDCLLESIRSQREDLVQILNVQDVYGDTALTIAARIGNKKLVRLLVESGANPQLVNEDGKTPQDYILELDGSQSLVSQHAGSVESPRKRAKRKVELALEATTHDGQPSTTDALTSQYSASPILRDIGKIIDECINSYERDQEHKDQLFREAVVELEMTQKRVELTNTTMRQLTFDTAALDAANTDAIDLQQQLQQVMEYTQMVRLQQFIKQYEESLSSSSSSSPSSTKTITVPSSSSSSKSIELALPPSSSSSSSPTTPEDDDDDQASLEQKWKQLVDRRQHLVKEIITLQAQTPNKRYQDYKRLISMCCNVHYENVDLMLSPLLASFEQTTQESTVD